MLFNSLDFLVFFVLFYFAYWFIFKRALKWQNYFLLMASYIFYAFWSIKFLGILVLSTLLDYFYGFGVASAKKRKSKLFLILSVINNLGILVVFKYYDFFAVQFQSLLGKIGIHSNVYLLKIVIPIGISFYTFHGMSYVFDIYRKKIQPVRNFSEYAAFVSFFPLLVAGPIERADHLLPQIQRERKFNYMQSVEGCRLVLWGMFKKIVVADTLAGFVDPAFANYHNTNGMILLLAAIGFSFQIYADFSGYSDIAIGISKLLGFELISNFKFPYFSRNIAEFWKRWHISLSSWFRDYLYIPLGGSKNGRLITYRNILIIFIVSAFWHGADWKFITWGFIHACAFLPLVFLKRNHIYKTTVIAQDSFFPGAKEFVGMFITFMLVTLAWIFFRSASLTDSVKFIKILIIDVIHLNKPDFNITSNNVLLFVNVFVLVGFEWKCRKNERVLKFSDNRYIRHLVYVFLLFSIFSNYNKIQEFIYFQF